MPESTVSASIFEPPSSNVTRLNYELVVTGADGAPLAGLEVVATLEGDGSMSPSFSSKEVRRETDASGAARITWYRRSIFQRDVHATLTVAAPSPAAGVELHSIDVDAVSQGPSITWAPRRLRF